MMRYSKKRGLPILLPDAQFAVANNRRNPWSLRCAALSPVDASLLSSRCRSRRMQPGHPPPSLGVGQKWDETVI